MRNKVKAKFVTLLMFILLVVLACDVIAVVPGSLPWILGTFAVPGSIWFIKLLYRWLTEDPDMDDAERYPMRYQAPAAPEVFNIMDTKPFKRAKR